jgi:hypothetical protein
MMSKSDVAQTTSASRVDVSSWTIKNPDGPSQNVSFDILKRRNGDREHSCLVYVRSKLRCWDRSIDQATPHRDLVSHQLLLPPEAPDLFASQQMLWSAVDEATNWEGEPHLLAGPTIWFPQLKSQNWAIRQATTFAQIELADKHGVAVHVVAHAPSRIAHGGDFHVHLLCTARKITSTGLGTFVPQLLRDGCQTGAKNAWDAWWKANPMP